MSKPTETQQIELASAKSFLREYNRANETSYEVVCPADAPDILCKDSTGDVLNLEMTTSDDRDGDIQAALGRSEGRSVDVVKTPLERGRQGRAHVLSLVSNLETDVVPRVAECIRKKLLKDYGTNVALVVYHKTGCQWTWDRGVRLVRDRIDLTANPYDKGIWILDWLGDDKYRIYRVDVTT